MTTRFDSKDPGEQVTLGFDFTKLGTPANPTVEISVRKGTDAAPSAVLLGLPAVIGTWVYQRVQGGVDEVDYAVRCLADIGQDRMLIDAILPVRARPTPGA